MKRLLAYFVAAALLVAAGPAFAGTAIINGGGTGGQIATGSQAAGGNTVTSSASTVDVPIGSLVEIGAAENVTSSSYTGCTDSAGNNYGANISSNANGLAGTTTRTWLITTIDAPIGTTWTCTSASTAIKGIMVAAWSGAAASPFDLSATPTTGSGTVASIGPTGTLACPGGGANCEVLVAVWNHDNITGQTGLTSGFTYLGSNGSNGTNLSMAYEIVSATTAQSFQATNGNSGAWVMKMDAFKAATSGGTNKTCTIAAVGGGTC